MEGYIMKKLGAMLAVCVLGLALAACGNPQTAQADSTDPVPPADSSGSAADVPPDASAGSGQAAGSGAGSSDPNTRAFGDCSVTVLDYSIREDADGNSAVRIQYQFTNHSKTAASFSTTVIPNAYQGTSDTRLHYTTPAERDPAYTALLTLVEPGESIVCAGYFELSDTETPVNLKVTDLRDSSAKALCRTLEIAGMEQEPYIDTSEQQRTSAQVEQPAGSQ